MSNANGRKTLEEAKAGIHGAVANALAVCLEVAVQERDKILQQRTELLEALKVAVSYIDEGISEERDAIISLSMCVITKAEAAE